MADLSRATLDRGQLLLASAIGLALLLIVLAVLLNTAIYTEALASSSDIEYEERAALAQFDALERAMPGLLTAINDQTEAPNPDELEAILEAEVQTWASYTNPSLAVDGAAFDVTVIGTETGERVIHDDVDQTFTDANGTTEWVVAENATTIRAFELTVSPTDLHDAGNATCAPAGPCFQVVVEDANGTASTVAIYTNETADVALTIERPDGNHTCTIGANETTIDLVEGSVDGSQCGGLDILDELSPPYTVAYEHGEHASGSYILGLDGGHTSRASFTDNASPRVEPWLHGVDLLATYESSRLELTRTIAAEVDDR